ncbi:MAG TPA: hypothetical protein VIA06_20775 [Candidatus Dormibacteraeota bacterium]|jgi:hypothetical protein|nr:hypothetical protein [Candidatus Dormibacteraeota bacterium]
MGMASLVWILILVVIVAGVVITIRAQRGRGPARTDQQPTPSPQAPLAAQQYSADGRWWWDGTRWVPVPPSQHPRQPPVSGGQ